jgi:hypothetical protein
LAAHVDAGARVRAAGGLGLVVGAERARERQQPAGNVLLAEPRDPVVRAPAARFGEPGAAFLLDADRAPRLGARQRQNGFDRQRFEVAARRGPAGAFEQRDKRAIFERRIGGVGAHGRCALAVGKLSERRGAFARDRGDEVCLLERVAPAVGAGARVGRFDGEPIGRCERLVGV